METRDPTRRCRPVSPPVIRLVVASALVAVVVGVVPQVAHAAASGGDGPGGTITVGASDGGTVGGEPGGPGTGVGGGGSGPSPWLCTSTELTLNDEGGFAPGGPTPGSWYSVTCENVSTGASTTETEWIPDPPTAQAPAVDPHAVALQAEASLRLPTPAVHFDPAGQSVVNLPTWLWIDRGIWHPASVTASVGPVSATAVATPVSVTWTMGDGGSTTCDGPGTPYDPELASSSQSTSCFYTYAVSSAGQSTLAGGADDDAFKVVATIDWSVTWTAQGAAGGGTLPPLVTSSSALVPVEQVESLDTLAGFFGSPPPIGGQ
jgi:hypothetical protein